VDLLFQRPVQGIDFLFEMIVQRLLAETTILGSRLQQIAQQRDLTRLLPDGRRRQGDRETGRQGEGTGSLSLPVSRSPCLPVFFDEKGGAILGAEGAVAQTQVHTLPARLLDGESSQRKEDGI